MAVNQLQSFLHSTMSTYFVKVLKFHAVYVFCAVKFEEKQLKL